jgi:hypothetical protein
MKRVRVSLGPDGKPAHWLKVVRYQPACGAAWERKDTRLRVARSVGLSCPTCRELLAVWWEGYSAWWDALDWPDNPYPQGTAGRIFWAEGWWYAKRTGGEGGT